MKLSHLFGQTLRESPSEGRSKGYEYLLRGAYLRFLPDGSTAHLPLGQKLIENISRLLRQALTNSNAQELLIMSPTTSGEEGSFSSSLHRLLALAQKEIHSYRQLPQRLYQFQTSPSGMKYSGSNPLRMRVTTSLDCIALDTHTVTSDESYGLLLKLVGTLMERLALPISTTNADSDLFGQSILYHFPLGDQVALECHACSYLDVVEAACIQKIPAQGEAPKKLEKVPTSGAHTISDLASFLNIPESETAKAVFSMATIPNQDQLEEQLVFSIVRGDMELNEVKLARTLGAQSIRPATEAEITSVGAVPGFASPVGIDDAIVVVDDLIPLSPNMVAGANEAGFHYLNVNHGRDYQADFIADIVQAGVGDDCPNCGNPMHSVAGIVLAKLKRVPLEVSQSFNLTYLDANGIQQPIYICAQSVNLHNLMAALAEEHHDEFGLKIPAPISPLQIHLIRLKGDEGQADLLYQRFKEHGYKLLYDDRSDQPGVKFNDADLIGLPIRITVGKRSLASGGIEVKLRDHVEKEIVSLEGIDEFVKNKFENLV